MPQYMLLLYDDPSHWKDFSPEEMQKVIGKYVAWGAKLREKGLIKTSHKLADDVGKVVRGRTQPARVTDGPYSETKEILGGFYLIETGDYKSAVETAKDCPHLEYGGTIEVREVDPMMGG